VNTQILPRCVGYVADIPEHEISALRALSGYEQMLEIERISKQYGASSVEIQMHLTGSNQSAQPFTPSSKEAPNLPSQATVLEKSNFRFEYDPTAEAADRRQSVSQAILCPGCGVALGIPDIRPIKVTCPQCLLESQFNA